MRQARQHPKVTPSFLLSNPRIERTSLSFGSKGSQSLNDPPDFLFQVRAPAAAAIPLALAVGVVVLIAAVTAIVPALRQDRGWVVAVAIGGPTFLLAALAWFGEAVARGGVYRVEVRKGRLRVDSPSRRVFGPGFEVDLAAIQRLVVRPDGDWPEVYEVHTAAGAFRIDSVCGGDLFEVIRRVRPGVSCEQAY